ncbi:Hydroxyproline dehydrogenase, variant 2 [Chamberlinius hualienensis]
MSSSRGTYRLLHDGPTRSSSSKTLDDSRSEAFDTTQQGQSASRWSVGATMQNCDLDFENHKEAFKDKTTWEVFRNLTILKLCGFDAFANNSLKLAGISKTILRERLFTKLMKMTVYGQFVAGDTEKSVTKTVVALRKVGIRSIISCNIEEDPNEDPNSEAIYERCVERIAQCINMAILPHPDLPKAQVKLTGKLQPNLLIKLTDVVNRDPSGQFEMIKAISDIMQDLNAKLPESIRNNFSEEEQQQLHRGIQRMKVVGQLAMEKDVVLLIDAEFININPGISILAMAMMGAFNKKKPIVWNTYQCYLKKGMENILSERRLVEQLGVCFGAKIVRGAYLEQEKQRAAENGYPDPINESFEATSKMYHDVADLMFKYVRDSKGRCQIIVATHNENSVRFAVQRLAELGIPNDGSVTFGQLYGMCDQITFPLARKGYVVYKCTPYGTVDEVLPYLYRRAMENQAVIKGSRKEVKLLQAEMKYRTKRMFKMSSTSR